MTARLDDMARRAELEAARQAYFNAPHGQRQRRLAHLRAVATRFLRQDVAARRKRRGR